MMPKTRECQLPVHSIITMVSRSVFSSKRSDPGAIGIESFNGVLVRLLPGTLELSCRKSKSAEAPYSYCYDRR